MIFFLSAEAEASAFTAESPIEIGRRNVNCVSGCGWCRYRKRVYFGEPLAYGAERLWRSVRRCGGSHACRAS